MMKLVMVQRPQSSLAEIFSSKPKNYLNKMFTRTREEQELEGSESTTEEETPKDGVRPMGMSAFSAVADDINAIFNILRFF
jgi:hypothetical protein